MARGSALTGPFLVLAAAVVLWPDIAWADDGFASYQARGGGWAFLAAFGFGFLTSLTPCVYPMIPIVVGVFGARDDNVSRGKAMSLATLYVLGMATLYSSLGVVFALLGKTSGFGSLLANPAVIVPVAILYVALAASMFGAFELNLPSSWQNRLNRVGGRGYLGSFAMGLVGGLTAAPCTGPFIAGILGFVASTGSALMGTTLLFSYALGMGVLFWVIAVFAVSLPRSGRWMEAIKGIGGIALLVAAIYFLRPVIPGLASFGASGQGGLVTAIVLAAIGLLGGSIHLSFHDAPVIRARKGVTLGLAVIGLAGILNGTLAPDRALSWHHDEAPALALAQTEGKGVMIDFAARWCLPCAKLDKTFADESVAPLLTQHFVLVKFDVTEATEQDEALQEKYNAHSLPAVIFLNSAGDEIDRLESYVEAPEFLRTLQRALERLSQRAASPARAPDPS